MNDVTLPPPDREDLAVGSNGLASRRDYDLKEQLRDEAKWVSVPMRRNSVSSHPTSAPPPPVPTSTILVYLPKSRDTVNLVVESYFTRLNFHRPVLLRSDFERTLNALYDNQALPHDPGFICSAYLVFALGTLSELNHRVSKIDPGNQTPAPKPLMPADWPEHEEFFQLALSVKPDLRVTVSSLQALTLLQWYLYTEVSAPKSGLI